MARSQWTVVVVFCGFWPDRERSEALGQSREAKTDPQLAHFDWSGGNAPCHVPYHVILECVLPEAHAFGVIKSHHRYAARLTLALALRRRHAEPVLLPSYRVKYRAFMAIPASLVDKPAMYQVTSKNNADPTHMMNHLERHPKPQGKTPGIGASVEQAITSTHDARIRTRSSQITSDQLAETVHSEPAFPLLYSSCSPLSASPRMWSSRRLLSCCAWASS